jgi:hypothetical protein
VGAENLVRGLSPELAPACVGVALPAGPYWPAATVAMVGVLEEVCAGQREEATAQLAARDRRKETR